jgi:hypothetical protein
VSALERWRERLLTERDAAFDREDFGRSSGMSKALSFKQFGESAERLLAQQVDVNKQELDALAEALTWLREEMTR